MELDGCGDDRKVQDLSWLVDATPKPVYVKLGDGEYLLRTVDVLEELLLVLNAAEKMGEIAKGKEPATVEELAALREELYGMIRTLVPDLPLEYLRVHFHSVQRLLSLFKELLRVVQENCGELVKKN